MTKTIALPLILAATLGLAACHKADTSTENSVDMNVTTNESVADVNAADASTMTAGNDMGATGSTGAMSDNSMSSSSSMNSSTSTSSTSKGAMSGSDMDSAAGNATTDAMHNKE